MLLTCVAPGVPRRWMLALPLSDSLSHSREGISVSSGAVFQNLFTVSAKINGPLFQLPQLPLSMAAQIWLEV